ncbi:MAG: site-specific DNA-methyltransferase [Planctomycetaceae bacterium]|nr:site-specific DNA-methyltransferase [Planctomycetaceae bacterium]
MNTSKKISVAARKRQKSERPKIVSATQRIATLGRHTIWEGDCRDLLRRLPRREFIDLVVTSPPYNVGKEYESVTDLRSHIDWICSVFEEIIPRLKSDGSFCLQVGTYVRNDEVIPLDYLFFDELRRLGLHLRNRIIWRFGHGLHCKKRFSPRHEVVLWFSKNSRHEFDLDAVRVPSKYPGKKAYKGPNKGNLSANPLGKNPEDVWDFNFDVWDIPNVKSRHPEKTQHPCQFPVSLAQRLILALTKKGDLVFDPFAGVCTTGVAAALEGRHSLSAEIWDDYVETGRERIAGAIDGTLPVRPYDKPVFDHRLSPLSKRAVS